MNDMKDSKPIKMKLAILGDPYVGKSHFLNTYSDSAFFDPSVSLNTSHKKLEKTISPYKFILDINEFNAKNDKIIYYIQSCEVVFIILDLNNRNSFDNLNDCWFPFLKNDCQFCNPVYILGNYKEDSSPPLTGNEEINEMIKFAQIMFNVSYLEIGDKNKEMLCQKIDEIIKEVQKDQMKNHKSDCNKGGSLRVEKCQIY